MNNTNPSSPEFSPTDRSEEDIISFIDLLFDPSTSAEDYYNYTHHYLCHDHNLCPILCQACIYIFF